MCAGTTTARGLPALGGVDPAATPVGGATTHGQHAAVDADVLAARSITSPQRSPHQADLSTRARNRPGAMASASAATSSTVRITGSRGRGGFIARVIWHGLSASSPSPTAVAQMLCSSE